MSFDSKVTKVAYTVCGHVVEKKTQIRRVEKPRAFLFRKQSSLPKCVQVAYGWCPSCTEYYRYDVRNAHCILKFWKFKRSHGFIGAVPQSCVPGSVLFDTMTNANDVPYWPTALEDMAGFLNAFEYVPDPAVVESYRDLGRSQADAERAATFLFAVKMRDATLEWAQGEWDNNWIRVKASISGDPEVYAPVLSRVPQHPKHGKDNPVLFDPDTRCSISPNLQDMMPLPPPSSEQATLFGKTSVELHGHAGESLHMDQDNITLEICFRLDDSSSSPSLLDVPIKSSSSKTGPVHRRKPTPFLDLYTSSRRVTPPTSASPRRSPQSAPPRPSMRLAACSQHGKSVVVRDCEECKRIRLSEIAIPPSSAKRVGCKSAPLSTPDESIWCSQALCYCEEVGKDNCPTCPLRAKSAADGVVWM